MTLFGPDGSHWQFGITVPASDWAKVDFVIWRASIGTRSDATFGWARQKADENDKAICAYHFVYPRARYAPEAQAQAFHSMVGDTNIPAMIDWESDGSLAPDWDDVLVVANAIRDTGHKVALVYTGRWYWAQQGYPTMAGYGLDMVNAWYGPNQTGSIGTVYGVQGGDSGPGWRGYGALEPAIWQFGSRITFGSAAMDMNACRADRSELHRWFHDPQYHPLPPPQPPGPAPEPIVEEFYDMPPRGALQ